MAVNQVEEFLAALRPLQDEDSIKKLCEFEVNYLDNSLALTSKKRAITRYRNEIKRLDSDHAALKYFKLSKEETVEVKALYKEQVYQDHTNLRPIDVDKLILNANSLLESQSYITVALGLMLLTGRRATEILKTARFELINENTVLFTGQLKTKGSTNAQNEPYKIPVLASADEIIKALSRLRTMRDFSDLSNDQVHSRSNKSLNEYSKKYFKDLIKNVSPKDLRAAYACICHYCFCPDHISQTAYFAMILGHSEQDLTTAQSYQDFYIEE